MGVLVPHIKHFTLHLAGSWPLPMKSGIRTSGVAFIEDNNITTAAHESRLDAQSNLQYGVNQQAAL